MRRSGTVLFLYKKHAASIWGSGPRQGEGEDEESIKRLFTPEFRNRPDAVIAFAPLSRGTIDRVLGKFVLELERSFAPFLASFSPTCGPLNGPPACS